MCCCDMIGAQTDCPDHGDMCEKCGDHLWPHEICGKCGEHCEECQNTGWPYYVPVSTQPWLSKVSCSVCGRVHNPSNK